MSHKVPTEVREFLDGLAGRSNETIENYESFANVFWRFIDKPLKDVTVKDIMQFVKWGVDEKGWKLSTMKQYAKLAQRFMSEFKDEEFIDELKKQIRMLPKLRMYEKLYEGIYIPGDKIDALIEAAPNEEYAVVYTMILKWGARLEEALNQRLEDLDPKLKRVTIRGKGPIGGKARLVWVDEESLRRVLNFARGSVLPEINGVRTVRRGRIVNLKKRSIELEWKKTSRKIGIPYWKKLTPHDGRHSYAIDFLLKRKNQGMLALTLLKNQLGHSNVNTTMIYLDISGTESRDVFDAGVQKDEV